MCQVGLEDTGGTTQFTQSVKSGYRHHRHRDRGTDGQSCPQTKVGIGRTKQDAQGIRGVGEVPIVPPLAAVANAINQAIGLRLNDLPMSPPKVLKALSDAPTDSGG